MQERRSSKSKIVDIFNARLIVVLLYVSALVLHIYVAHRRRLYRRLAQLVEDPSMAELLLGGREIVATIWVSHARLWHGYELSGLDNIPTEVSKKVGECEYNWTGVRRAGVC